jgi:hypothetical protein
VTSQGSSSSQFLQKLNRQWETMQELKKLYLHHITAVS